MLVGGQEARGPQKAPNPGGASKKDTDPETGRLRGWN